MKKSIILIFLSISLLLLFACSKSEDTLKNLNERELAENQTLVTGQVTSRVGNDIELAIGTLTSAQGPNGAQGMPSGDMEEMPVGEEGAMPAGGQGGGFEERQMPEGDFEDGGMPDVSSQDETADDAAQDMASSGYGIQLSGETISLRIPVGTDVLVTSNDALTVSSFGRIQEEDLLQLILNTQADGTQTVVEIQIME